MSERQSPHDMEESDMNAIPYERTEQDWDGHEDESFEMQRRPRRRLLNVWSALLLAVIVGAACFYAGVRVEKGQVSGSSSSLASTFASRLASRLGGGTASSQTAGATGRSGATPASGTRGAAAAGGGGAAAGGFAGAFGGGNADFGTIASVGRNALYLTDSSGNIVKVTLSSATQVSKTVSVSKSAVRPGDTVVVRGAKNASGTIAATTITDSGASTSGSGSGSGSGSSSSGSGSSASSAVSSLFGSGG
jgi:hypothetical protein